MSFSKIFCKGCYYCWQGRCWDKNCPGLKDGGVTPKAIFTNRKAVEHISTQIKEDLLRFDKYHELAKEENFITRKVVPDNDKYYS